MKYWLISDTHFGHDSIIKYCNRPNNFEDKILNNLKIINKGDILIHLGDFCIGNDKNWHDIFFERLPVNVKKILIIGNHDRKSNSWYLKNGWDFICNSFSSKLLGTEIIFSHIPKLTDKVNIHGHYHNNLPRLLKKEFISDIEKERNKNEFNLSNYDKNIHKLVSIEDNNYFPVTLNFFLKK